MDSLIKSTFLETLDEQASLSFTGRIEVFKNEKHQLLGSLVLLDGIIVKAQYLNKKGEVAIEKIIAEDFMHGSLKFLAVPELVNEKYSLINLSFHEVYDLFQETIKRVSICQKLRPPEHVKLVIQSEFIFAGEEILSDEFDLLCIISEFNRVSDIYAHSEAGVNEVTMALVSLRKKNALRVIGS